MRWYSDEASYWAYIDTNLPPLITESKSKKIMTLRASQEYEHFYTNHLTTFKTNS